MLRTDVFCIAPISHGVLDCSAVAQEGVGQQQQLHARLNLFGRRALVRIDGTDAQQAIE